MIDENTTIDLETFKSDVKMLYCSHCSRKIKDLDYYLDTYPKYFEKRVLKDKNQPGCFKVCEECEMGVIKPKFTSFKFLEKYLSLVCRSTLDNYSLQKIKQMDINNILNVRIEKSLIKSYQFMKLIPFLLI